MDKTKPNVLFVDDEPVNLMLFEANFGSQYNIFTAQDGNNGLDILSRNNCIELVFSDMKMPRMNGLQFIENAMHIAPQGHFYIMSGFDMTEEIQAAIDKGFVKRYFSKPLNFKEISSEIERVRSEGNRT